MRLDKNSSLVQGCRTFAGEPVLAVSLPSIFGAVAFKAVISAHCSTSGDEHPRKLQEELRSCEKVCS